MGMSTRAQVAGLGGGRSWFRPDDWRGCQIVLY